MTETNHAAMGADTLTDEQILAIASDPATCPALPWWFKDEVVSSDVRDSLLRFARAVERAALASAAQPTNDWAQSAAELIAMRGYLADPADTARVAHLLAQIVPATQRLPTTQAAPQHAAQGDAEDAASTGFFLQLPQRPKPEAPAGTVGLDWDAYSGAQILAYGRDCSDAAIVATQKPGCV